MRKTTPVHTYMSHLPVEIDRRDTLANAITRMGEQGIRHLPVLDGPRLFGILSRHDVQVAMAAHGTAAGAISVGEACTIDPLTVAPSAAIPDVARRMVERGVTSALVVDGDVLVGIFTAVDALRLLAEV